MSIQTYTCGFMTSTGDKVIPLLTLDNEGNVALKQGRFCPGDMVKHALCGGRGTVIGVVDCEVVVLWSRINDAFRPLDDELDRIRKAL